jgi:hypothetical protein
MRVTHVITRLIVGGAQENTVATVVGLQKKSGVEVNLISGPTIGLEGSLESSLQAANTNFTIVPELVRRIHPLKDFLALRKLENIFREQKPDIVHTHSGKAGIVGRLAARRAGVPIIIHTIHGPSLGNGLLKLHLPPRRGPRRQRHRPFHCRRRRDEKPVSRRRNRPARAIHENFQRLPARTISCGAK